MMSELKSLFFDFWWLFALALLIGMVSQLVYLQLSRRRRRYKGGYRAGPNRWSPGVREFPQKSGASQLGDPSAQMEFISRVDFEPRRLLNKSEYSVLVLLESVARQLASGHRVMAQTSLGEIIGTKATSGSKEDRDLAFRSVNSKRLDFLIIDRFGQPLLAVEYQGHGHYQGKAFMRDAVKREAVRKAGIGFLEVPAKYDKEILQDQIHAMLSTDHAHRRAS